MLPNGNVNETELPTNCPFPLIAVLGQQLIPVPFRLIIPECGVSRGRFVHDDSSGAGRGEPVSLTKQSGMDRGNDILGNLAMDEPECVRGRSHFGAVA